MTPATLAEILGGQKTFSRDMHSDMDLADAMRSGISYRAVERVIETGMLSSSEVYDLVGSRRSLTRSKREGRALSPDESDRLTRVARVIGCADEALGDRESAYRWLRTPNRALRGRKPLELLTSYIGARIVEQTSGRIEQGVHS